MICMNVLCCSEKNRNEIQEQWLAFNCGIFAYWIICILSSTGLEFGTAVLENKWVGLHLTQSNPLIASRVSL
jgi:hypothetical protein